MIYLTGSKVFDPNDDNWATSTDYQPTEKYLLINPAETVNKEWESVLQKVKTIIENYTRSSLFGQSILKTATAITTGFDDGNLIRIR